MELKSLILGLIFSVGIFAVKSGAGLSYTLGIESKLFNRLRIIAIFFLGYGLLFLAVWYLLRRVNLTEHLDTLMLFFKNGMTIHFLLAALLLVWGVTLLKERIKAEPKRSHGWILLSLPCPVCFSVILFSGSFLQNLMPENPWVFVWFFCGFMTISITTSLIISFWGTSNPEHGLGSIMVLAALYFIITIAMVPQFGDLERIYRLSKTSITVLSNLQLLPLLLGAVAAFSTGLIATIVRDRTIGSEYTPADVKSRLFSSINIPTRKLPWT